MGNSKLTYGSFKAIVAQIKRDYTREHIERVAKSQGIPYTTAKRIVEGKLTTTTRG